MVVPTFQNALYRRSFFVFLIFRTSLNFVVGLHLPALFPVRRCQNLLLIPQFVVATDSFPIVVFAALDFYCCH